VRPTSWGGAMPCPSSRKLRECLEYVVVHELADLLEPTHNARFIALMDQLMPEWRFRRRCRTGFPCATKAGAAKGYVPAALRLSAYLTIETPSF
jgi:hypothetical protein